MATDEDELLEIDKAKSSDATPSKDDLMMNILTQMSANLNIVSEALKHLRQSNSTTGTLHSRPKKPNRRLKSQCLNQTIVIVMNYSPARLIQGQQVANETKIRMVYLTK